MTFITGKRPSPNGSDAAQRLYIIAEAGLCHFGSYDLARFMLHQAFNAGADCFKTQVFGEDFGGKLKSRLRDRRLAHDQLGRLKEEADQLGIDFLLTPHDEYGYWVVKALELDQVKIGSGEVGNWPFIERILDLELPTIISTGMYSEDDLGELLDIINIMRPSEPSIALLHCVSEYPCGNPNLGRMLALDERTDANPIGYSDHTGSPQVLRAAAAMGAEIIELHFTPMDHPWFGLESNDQKASIWVGRLEDVISGIRDTADFRGTGEIDPSPAELKTLEWAKKDPETNRRI